MGNAMMMPRALYTKDLIWFAGSSWGYMLMGWGQLLSLYIGTLDGSRYVLGGPLALLYTSFDIQCMHSAGLYLLSSR